MNYSADIGTLAEALASRISDREWINEIADEIRLEANYPMVMQLALYSGRDVRLAQVAFRAAWVLDTAYFADRQAFIPYSGRLVEDFNLINNPSARRHYTKILSDLLRRGLITLTASQLEMIAERCFDYLIDTQTLPAVKVWSMEILADLVPQVDWIAEHLGETLRHQIESGTPAIESRGRKILQRIKKL